MAINPALFRCCICDGQPADYFYFQKTEAGNTFREEYPKRFRPGLTGAQPRVDDPDTACLCERHTRLAEAHCAGLEREDGVNWLEQNGR